MAMAGIADVGLWRGVVWSGLGKSVKRTSGVQFASCMQQRIRKFEVFADQRRVEEVKKSIREKTGPSLKATGIFDVRLAHYVQDQVREPAILRELREETEKTQPSFAMQVARSQGQLLAMLARLMGAEKCIEVGVFAGYSSLAVALVLPDSGRLVACDRDERTMAFAEKYFKLAGVSHKVDIRLGMAVDTLNQLLLEGGAGSYDFAFLDADKRMYPKYYELLLQLMRPGGLIMVDNVLWHGDVADPEIVDVRTQTIRDFNAFLLTDDRIDYSLVTIGDGMSLCRKK